MSALLEVDFSPHLQRQLRFRQSLGGCVEHKPYTVFTRLPEKVRRSGSGLRTTPSGEHVLRAVRIVGLP
jgi:hypothetical protein